MRLTIEESNELVSIFAAALKTLKANYKSQIVNLKYYEGSRNRRYKTVFIMIHTL